MASNETIYGEMTADEARCFEAECKRFPWLSQVTMSDADLCNSIDRDIRPGVSFNLFSGWRLHYGWVFINILKYFYEHGEFKHFDRGYIDSQAEYLIALIMRTHGADTDQVENVLSHHTNFQFTPIF
jgi:hypothetical protein